MSGASIDLRGVWVSFGKVRVLKGVDLSVQAGSFVALLGSSGCGKTTLLRAISGFKSIDQGEIEVNGKTISGLPPERRGMAMVFQSYALWPHMSVAQNIGYGLKLRRMAKKDIAAKVTEMLELLDLTGLGGRNVTDLSGGQRQRVALGRALAINPEILLLDEPLSNLDAKIRLSMRHEIKTIQQRLGLTAIHVTHDREEAMVMADRIIIMDEGLIAQDGAPEDVYQRPNSPFVASFLGADNIILTAVQYQDGGVTVQIGHGITPVLLPIADTVHEGVNIHGDPIGECVIHFRGEAARLVPAEAETPSSLHLAGTITQASYPGGKYRYSVDTAVGTYLIDHDGRLAPGESVNICIPASALHLYPAPESRRTKYSC